MQRTSSSRVPKAPVSKTGATTIAPSCSKTGDSRSLLRVTIRPTEAETRTPEGASPDRGVCRRRSEHRAPPRSPRSNVNRARGPGTFQARPCGSPSPTVCAGLPGKAKSSTGPWAPSTESSTRWPTSNPRQCRGQVLTARQRASPAEVGRNEAVALARRPREKVLVATVVGVAAPHRASVQAQIVRLVDREPVAARVVVQRPGEKLGRVERVAVAAAHSVGAGTPLAGPQVEGVLGANRGGGSEDADRIRDARREKQHEDQASEEEP